MSYTIYDASIVAAKHLLTSLQGILTKAEAHPDAASHPDRRLAPEMLPLSFQIWSVCTVAEAQALTLQQKEAVTKQYEESPLPTYAAMRARIEQVLALLETVDRDAAVEAGEKMTSIDFKREVGRKELSGTAFCAGTGIPNMYFHTAIAYAILRNAGVELGKLDYLGPFVMANIGM
ncbi:hypothetical protein CRV24_002782 [Beauveria bassiana]|uniref:Helix-turn-helix domain-containing protein n=1 Tax=Beauveria bassiana (strain ARSEF 2860) TaxID=655819 RepID=J5K5M1_BEAB2|nr:helix-turn-helix domain-containing protein [Beauveria bassiana ARSEF 2860]EJP69366.1 helix-turn-helix domain-containing protein [Beauveria bassiana ARSEF 2860]KAF1737166.1 hypothetical protein CRV24_002782 [Beauveria bassiana]KAH8718170.1 hypothetical protein HC256_002823 [Beauveria bassiana]